MKEKKKNRCVEVDFHFFSCALFSSAQLFCFPGRATDPLVMTLGTIPNFLTYVYRKVNFAFLFIISSIAHLHVLKVFRKITYVRLEHLLPTNLQTYHQFWIHAPNPYVYFSDAVTPSDAAASFFDN